MSTPVTLERYAEMRAEMDAGRLRDEVLARTGMTTDEWTDAQRGWLERMGTELERGRFELTNRYTQAFLERQRALSTAAPPPLAAAAAPPPLAKTGPMPPIVAPMPFPFAKDQQDHDEPVRTPLAPPVAVLHQALPFQKSPPGLDKPDPIAAPENHSPPRGKQETPAPEWDRTPPSTVPAAILRDRPSLPFVTPAEAAREASSSPSTHDEAAPRPGAGGGGARPFAPKAAPAPPVEQTHPSAGLSSQQSLEAMKRAHGLSLAQYAQICATITAFPERVVEIRSQHGLDVNAWTTLHALWQERFQRDSMLEPRWEALVKAALSRLAR